MFGHNCIAIVYKARGTLLRVRIEVRVSPLRKLVTHPFQCSMLWGQDNRRDKTWNGDKNELENSMLYLIERRWRNPKNGVVQFGIL